MKKLIQTIQIIIPFLEQYPNWVKIAVAIGVLYAAFLLICLLFFRPPQIEKIEPPPQSTGFKINGNKNIIKGNLSINNQIGFDISGEQNVIEDNLSVGILEDRQDTKQIEEILGANLDRLKQSTNKESAFDLALLHSSAAKKYATFGIWDKAIYNEYKALSFYLKTGENDPSEILKKLDNRTKKIVIELSPSHVASHLLFISKRIRNEKDKDYKYFLSELLKHAKKNNDIKVIDFLKEKINKGSNPPFDFN